MIFELGQDNCIFSAFLKGIMLQYFPKSNNYFYSPLFLFICFSHCDFFPKLKGDKADLGFPTSINDIKNDEEFCVAKFLKFGIVQ
jgi:hypothetical protein